MRLEGGHRDVQAVDVPCLSRGQERHIASLRGGEFASFIVRIIYVKGLHARQGRYHYAIIFSMENFFADKRRLRVLIHGTVQGVGFRPFVYKLATSLGLTGWVLNNSQGVITEAEGDTAALHEFLNRLQSEKPSPAFIESIEPTWLDPAGYDRFVIRESEDKGQKSTFISPDLAICPACLEDIRDPNNRRHRYPFTNCTHCGPRFTIIESLPYDRPNTTMKIFRMCDECQREYEDPLDRRFHAQPNACPVCGPHLELWNKNGEILFSHDDALLNAAMAIKEGRIVALKGLGGFQLLCDARNPDAIQALRSRKRREEKPFALMYPTTDLIRSHCEISDAEMHSLLSPQAPILLLKHRFGLDKWIDLADGVTPIPHPSCLFVSKDDRNPRLGVMLPYTPLHHLLMEELRFPVVATSGNLSDEPICTDEMEALDRLQNIADVFLVHNRPIARHADDSIVRVLLGREMMLRRARGFAPMPAILPRSTKRRLIAMGAHQKNTIAINVGPHAFLSQHIGDMDTLAALKTFEKVIADFRRLYNIEPDIVIRDSHPDYYPSQFAETIGYPLIRVQHHYAHIRSCMAENDLIPPVLGVAWDGSGYGEDGTIWGGEFIVASEDGWRRKAHLRTFRLPGGEAAIKEPRRAALGLLFEIFGRNIPAITNILFAKAFEERERATLLTMMERGVNSPLTSSMGRLFDGIASLTGLRQTVRHEGQAAMALEFAVSPSLSENSYPFRIRPDEDNSGAISSDQEDIVDWEDMVRGVLEDYRNKVDIGEISLRFHNTLARIILEMARRASLSKIVLSGGCFQNGVLLERTVQLLEKEGFRPYWHQRYPPNDGGLSLGQLAAGMDTDTPP